MYDLSDNQFYKIDMMVEKLKLYIESNQIDESLSYINKIKIQSNKIKGSYDSSLINVMDNFIAVVKNESNEFDYEDLLNKISSSQNQVKRMLSYWYLARIYLHQGKSGEAQNYHEKSKDLFDMLQNNLSSDSEKEYFRNTYYHNKILADLREEKDGLEEKVSYFLFCPGCGFKNDNKFAFCPSCGNDLKQ